MSEAIADRLRAYRPLDEWGEQGTHHLICTEAAETITELLEALEKAGGMLRDFITSVGADNDDRDLLAEIGRAIAKARGEV